MHPVIRIGTFLLLAVLLARAQPLQMGWVLCVIGLAFLLARGRGLGAAFSLMWRIRWILLSILLVYTWMPIGTQLESLWLALQRIALLMVMLLALQAWVLNMSRTETITGLYRLLSPFVFFGLPREKVVLRVMLTLDSVALLPSVLQQATPPDTAKMPRLKHISTRLISAITAVLAHCETIEHDPVRIETDKAVPLWQWSLPLIIMAVFFSLPVLE